MSGAALARAFEALAQALPEAQYPLPLDGAEALRGLANSMSHQLRDYLLPRARRLDAPLLAVVGGSTGAGKSTIVNSLLRAELSKPGVLRPTTKSPVLICHPDDEEWFSSDNVLPSLVRTDITMRDSRALRIVTFPGLPPGLALLDAPDIDSVDDANRALARQLLLAADLWLFVTSAARYADAVPWEYLAEAAERNTKLAVIVNRCPAVAMPQVASHLAEMLAGQGLANAKLFAIAERSLTPDGLLPETDVTDLRNWLTQLAEQAEARAAVAVQSLAGTVRSLDAQLFELTAGLERQRDARDELHAQAAAAYQQAATEVNATAVDGSMLRGEILSRWQDLVGTGDLMRSIEERISLMRDQVSGWLRGAPPAKAMERAISHSLTAVIRDAGQRAAASSAKAWSLTRWGHQIVAAEPALARTSPGFEEAAAATISGWQADIITLVQEQGAGKRMKARFLALGTNALGAALIVVVFSLTGGLTAAEVGIAGGTSLMAQRLLEAVFGEDAVRRLAQRAKEDLAGRIDTLFAGELARYQEILDAVSVSPQAAQRLETAAWGLRTAALEAFDDLTKPEV